jgi:hypothetical protein
MVIASEKIQLKRQLSPLQHTSSQPAKPSQVPTVVYPKRRSGGSENRVFNMGTYRLYCLDGVGKVMSAEWIDADDDKTAVEGAMQRVDGYAYELWDRSRLVMRIDPKRGGD